MAFVLGLDLDGVCADFYGRMREVVAELQEVEVSSLTTKVSYGLPEWGVEGSEAYMPIHRFAVTQRELFKTMKPIPGAVPSLRRLNVEGVRIRIITYRLFVRHFHKIAVAQTTEWLDVNGFPYHDLCFMKDKALVNADLYVEDTEDNIIKLQEAEKDVIAFTNSTNVDMNPPPLRRASTWNEAEAMIRKLYYDHLRRNDSPVPPSPGKPPPKGSEA